ncbi:hypothetical protein EAL2_c12290 [Peptoclostridium acidaminophilum DSM 3953]|uniref:UPF0122 protein EAL2_c12290 n=1 Tax=Peptoclostridium acidaminophilum DSM 3953 TaxID=1286171 RepID=W8T440_PEPAC|nr:putative DNA-binding protein [Peptoclostridium acidaminophilum]AHM56524.1 hypothetical protein EAL2_c12290 [Peptoclostridium acidaminophilum DSM 3953]
MDLDKVVEISVLFDFYGELLTDKQKDVVNLYYNEDYSLSEISENLQISRQAVYDTLKRAVKILKEYECKLRLLEKLYSRNDLVEEINEGLAQLGDMAGDAGCSEMADLIQRLKDCCRELLK